MGPLEPPPLSGWNLTSARNATFTGMSRFSAFPRSLRVATCERPLFRAAMGPLAG